MADIKWVSQIDGNWFDASNWEAGVLPVDGDTVIFNQNSNDTIYIIVDSTFPLVDINVQQGTFRLGSSNNNTPTVSPIILKKIQINESCRLEIVTATDTAEDLTISGAGEVLFIGMGVQDITGTVQLAGYKSTGNLNLFGNISGKLLDFSFSQILSDGGQIYFTDSGTSNHNIVLNGDTTIKVDSDKSVSLQGTLTGSGTLIPKGVVSIASSTDLTFSAKIETGNKLILSGTFSLLNPITCDGGTLEILQGSDISRGKDTYDFDTDIYFPGHIIYKKGTFLGEQYYHGLFHIDGTSPPEDGAIYSAEYTSNLSAPNDRILFYVSGYWAHLNLNTITSPDVKILPVTGNFVLSAYGSISSENFFPNSNKANINQLILQEGSYLYLKPPISGAFFGITVLGNTTLDVQFDTAISTFNTTATSNDLTIATKPVIITKKGDGLLGLTGSLSYNNPILQLDDLKKSNVTLKVEAGRVAFSPSYGGETYPQPSWLPINKIIVDPLARLEIYKYDSFKNSNYLKNLFLDISGDIEFIR